MHATHMDEMVLYIVQALGHDEWRGYNTTAITTIKYLSPKQVGIGKS